MSINTNIQDIITTCINAIIYIESIFLLDQLWTFVQDNSSQINPVQIVLYAANAWNKISDFFATYTPNIVKTCAYQINHLYNTIIAEVMGYKIEPFTSQWISISWTSRIQSETSAQYGTKYHDIYHFLLLPFTDIFENMYDIIHIINPIYLTNEVVIFIVNQKERIVRILYHSHVSNKPGFDEKKQVFEFFKTVYNNIEAFFFTKNSKTKSTVRFLAVTYTHPDMDAHTIDLDVKPEYFLEKNEILSYTFISRLLEYQPDKSYVFDDRYVVRVIDGNIKTVELTSNQYVLVGIRDYQIITL
jgi:hypothetical protein